MKKCILLLIMCSFSLLPTDQYHYIYGVIDRIIADIGVILIDEDGIEMELSTPKLPNGSKEGDIVKLRIINKEMIVLELCREKTQLEKLKSEQLLNVLRKKSS